jgi:hypothetical protein
MIWWFSAIAPQPLATGNRGNQTVTQSLTPRVLFRILILSALYHLSFHRPFFLVVGSTAVTAIPHCRESGFTHFISMYYS